MGEFGAQWKRNKASKGRKEAGPTIIRARKHLLQQAFLKKMQ